MLQIRDIITKEELEEFLELKHTEYLNGAAAKPPSVEIVNFIGHRPQIVQRLKDKNILLTHFATLFEYNFNKTVEGLFNG